MNELDSGRNFIKSEDSMSLSHQLDLQNCIEEFDIYQIPEEYADFCDGDSNPTLSSEFTYNIGNDGDHG